MLFGRWFRCTGPALVIRKHAAIDLRSGSYQLLDWVNGHLVALDGPESTGALDIGHNEPIGAHSYFWTIFWIGTGARPSVPVLSHNPAQLIVATDGTPGATDVVYVPAVDVLNEPPGTDPAIVPPSMPWPAPVPGCSRTPGPSVSFTTVDSQRAALVGQWLSCNYGIPGPTHAGIEIGADDRYILLERDAAGNLVPGRGLNYSGSMEYLESYGRIQVNFLLDRALTSPTFPEITASPRFLGFEGTTVKYVEK